MPYLTFAAFCLVITFLTINIVWVNASYYSKIAVVCNGSGENNLLFLWKYYHVVMDKVIYGTWLRGLENMLKVITISYLYDEYLRR